MLDRAALAALIAACRARGIAFVSDEIYHGIQYGDRAVSALEIDDEVYVINSFSKYFSMTGWRVGWMVVPEAHVRRIERLAQNLFICPPHASQVAALAALDARRRAGGEPRGLPRQPRAAGRGPAGGGLRAVRAAGRRVLRLSRRVGPDRGQPRASRGAS